MANAPITGLEVGTPKSTDFFVAVDTTDTTMAPTGTDKKYLSSAIADFILKSGATIVTKFVSSTGGVDAVGNGTLTAPYATPEYAINQISDASSSKIYVLKLSGNFSSTTVQIKPWIFIDGQNSIWNITNQVVAHASFVSGGGDSIIENISNFNTVGGVNVDLSAAGSASVKINNVVFTSSANWTIKGNPADTTDFTLTNSVPNGLTPNLSCQDCYGRIENSTVKGLTLITSSTAQAYTFQVSQVIAETQVLLQSNAGATGITVTCRSSVMEGGLNIKSLSGATIEVIQSGCTNLSGVTLDGTGVIYKTDGQNTAITLANGATIATNVTYISLSDGVNANFTPINYSPAGVSVKNHLEGIDAVLGGSGSNFLVKTNNLSDVASASTSRTNLGLGTMSTQNATAVNITGGTITDVNLSISAASNSFVVSNGGVVIKFNSVDGLDINGAEITNSSWSGGTISGTPINNSVIGGITPVAGTFTALTVPGFSTAGIIHNNASGVFSSSLIVNADINNATISNAKLSTMPAHTFKGNNTGSVGVPSDLTIADMKAELGIAGTLGTMAYQNANAVTITGGSISATNFALPITGSASFSMAQGGTFLKFNTTDGLSQNGGNIANAGWSAGLIASTTINSSTIGLTTPAAAKFTNLETTVGLILPTTGGTATLLDYYQREDFTLPVTGAWSGDLNIRFIRTGQGIIAHWERLVQAITTGSAQIATAVGAVPARYRPVGDMIYSIPVVNGAGSASYAHGNIMILATGQIKFTADNQTNFAASGFAGYLETAVSYAFN